MVNTAVSAAVVLLDFLWMMLVLCGRFLFLFPATVSVSTLSNSAASSFRDKKQIEESSPHVPVRIRDEPI